MATVKIYRIKWREDAEPAGTAESMTDAIIMIDHLLNGKKLADDEKCPAYYDYRNRQASAYAAYRQRDIIDFKNGKIGMLTPIYVTPYYTND